jgi:hypothetical protein
MTHGTLRVIALAAAVAAGCARGGGVPSSPVIRLDTTNPELPVVEVTGLSAPDLAALSRLNLTEDEWSALLRVSVSGKTGQPAGEMPAVTGRYAVANGIRFTPAFPLDPGRDYDVTFDPSKLARQEIARVAVVRAVVSLPAVVRTPSTVVAAVYPSGDVIPANQLRMYVQFSAPMGQQSGLDHIVLLGAAGREITDALLPLETELWNGDRTRYTVLFDPGRVKREILPNRQMGRPLRPREIVTFVVKSDWLDAQGIRLKSEFRREYRLGPPDEAPLSTAAWHIAPPSAGTRDGLSATFPEPLDHALLERAIGVSDAAGPVAGDVGIDAGERRWTFVPRDPWREGAYRLVVLPILEDLAGNRIGRAFEVRSPGDAVPPEDTRPTVVPFQIGAAGAGSPSTLRTP